MTENTTDVMNRGMQCLTETLGIVDAERFISIIIRERMDYTKWQRQHFDSLPPGAFHRNALDYAETNPYTGKAEKL